MQSSVSPGQLKCPYLRSADQPTDVLIEDPEGYSPAAFPQDTALVVDNGTT
jgi:hypothetical protein